MTRRHQQPVPQPGSIVIEDPGLSRNSLILLTTSAATVVASVGIAIAVARISTGIMWAAIILAGGQSLGAIIVSIGMSARHWLTGRALVIEARGHATAARIQARTALLDASHEIR